MEEKKIGEVTHYFSNIEVAIIRIDKEGLKLGEAIHIKGHTSDFTQTIESMQIEHKEVTEAKAKDVIGLKVKEHAREKDEVFKVIE